MKPRRLLALLFVLAAFGGASLPSAAAAEPFKVLAYNVENWLVTDRFVDNRRVPSAPKPDVEKDAVVTTILRHRPAVLGVVEIGTREDLEDLRTRLKGKGLDYPHVEWHDGPDAVRNLALLSQFPIVERNSLDPKFDLDGRPEHIQRGILDVTVEPAPGERLRLIGLHLKSRRSVKEFDEAALRAKEAWHVRKHLDAILADAPKARLLLFGDLNDTKNEYPIRQILGPRGAPASLIDIPVADSRGERWTHYWRTADEYGRIDFLMVSPALEPLVDRAASGIDDGPGGEDASDHRAIFVTIEPPAR